MPNPVANIVRELQRRNVIRGALLYLPAAWGIAQIVDLVAPAFDWPDSVLRNTIIALVLFFPVFLILTWIFELTPEGLKLEGSIDRSTEHDTRTGKLLDRSIIAVLLVAVTILAIDKFIFTSEPVRGSIAVFPFENLNQDERYDYLSEGISMQVLTLLSTQGRFDVIARETARKLQDRAGDFAEIHEILDVDYVLLGTIQASSDQLRTYARLVDVRTEKQVWAETIDVPIGDAFEIQDRVANAVASELSGEGEAVEIESYRPKDLAAWDAYVAGTSALAERTNEMIWNAEREFRKAIDLDPDYAAAYAGLGIAIALQGGGYGELTRLQARLQALPYAEKAVELAPDLAEAVAVLGFVTWLDDDKEDAEQVEPLFRKALQLDPAYAPAYIWLSNLLVSDLGEYGDSMAVAEEGLSHDPGSEVLRSNYIWALLARGRSDDADEQIERLRLFSQSYYERWKQEGSRPEAGDLSAMILAAMRTAANSSFERPNRLTDVAKGLNLLDLGLEARIVGSRLSSGNRVRIALNAGDWEEAGDIVAEMGDRVGKFEHLVLSWVFAHRGSYRDAAEHLETWWDASGHRVTQLGFFDHHLAALLVTLRRKNGQSMEQDDVLTSMREDVQRMRDAGIVRLDFRTTTDLLEGHYELVRGNHDRAVNLFESAIKNGSYPNFETPYFRDVLHRPEYQALQQTFDDTMTREKRELLDIVCVENPYPDVWTPMPETCSMSDTG